MLPAMYRKIMLHSYHEGMSGEHTLYYLSYFVSIDCKNGRIVHYKACFGGLTAVLANFAFCFFVATRYCGAYYGN